MGARYWKSLAKVTLNIINVMLFITFPLVILSTKITKLISDNKTETLTSREEISALAEIGTDQGIFLKKKIKLFKIYLIFKRLE